MWNLLVYALILFVLIVIILIGVNAFGAYGPFASLVSSFFPYCNKINIRIFNKYFFFSIFTNKVGGMFLENLTDDNNIP
jgi:hypothetical protein